MLLYFYKGHRELMIIITLFGIGMLAFGLFMMIKPRQFADGIGRFAEQRWFHPFEIISRAFIGILFLLLADQTPYPKTVFYIGIILCFVSIFLLILGEERHKRFARITVNIGKNFRYLGMIAIACGAGIIYLTIH